MTHPDHPSVWGHDTYTVWCSVCGHIASRLNAGQATHTMLHSGSHKGVIRFELEKRMTERMLIQAENILKAGK